MTGIFALPSAFEASPSLSSPRLWLSLSRLSYSAIGFESELDELELDDDPRVDGVEREDPVTHLLLNLMLLAKPRAMFRHALTVTL